MKMKKIAAWSGAVVATLILLMIVGAVLIQQNTFVHRDLLARAIQAGEKSSGARISIGNFGIRWMPLRITLSDVVARSRANVSAPPLAAVPQVDIGISWDALLHKKVDLTEVILDRPVVHFVTNNAGESNLPAKPASTTTSPGSQLQITIQHAAVRGGEVTYNDVPRKLEADLADFHLNVNHNGSDRYAGTLGYTKGEISVGSNAPLQHDAEIRFAATASAVTFERIRVTTASSQLNAKGAVQNFSHPVVRAEYQILVSSADLRRELESVPISSGAIQLVGSLAYDSTAGSGLAALKTSGRVSSETLMTHVASARLSLHAVGGDYLLQGGDLRVSGLRAETLGGVLHAAFKAQGLTATPRYQASLAIDSLSLGQAKQIAGVNEIPVRGTAHLKASADWVSSVQNLMARADATVSATVSPTRTSIPPTTASAIPVNAMLHLAYDAPRGTLAVTNSTFSSDKTTITANGTISDRSSLTVQARSSDLHETDLLIATLRNAMSPAEENSNAETPSAMNLQGMASLEAQIQGRIQNPRIMGHAEADGLRIRQTTWPHIQADFEASSSAASVKNGIAQTANRGHLNFALTTELQHWSYAASNPGTVQVQAVQIPVGDLEELAGFSAPVSGMLSANISAQGTLDNPGGRGSVELRNASLYGEPIRSVTAQFQGANKAVSASFSIAADAGTIAGNGEFDATHRGYRVSINHSVLNLANLHYLSARGYNLAGTLAIDAQGQGILRAPQLELALAGNQLAFRNTALGSVNAQVQVASEQVRFEVTSNIAGGQIEANGNAGLTAPYMTQAGFQIRSLNFGPLLATYAPSVGKQLQGDTEVRGQITGPLARPMELKATVDLTALKLAYQNLSLASAGPVHLNYESSVLMISQAELKGTDTDFKFAGTVPLGGTAPLNISTTGLVDLRLLGILGGNTQSSGTVKMDVTARGALKNPEIAGTVELAKASYISETAPIGIEDVNGRIAVANKRLTIESLSGQMGGGTFSASGFATYAPASYSLQINGKSVRIRYPEGTRAQLDAGLMLTGNTANSTLNGRVTIDQLSFTPNFDLANFVGQFASSAPSVPSKWEQNMHLDVAVASSDVLALSSSQLSLQGSVNLRVAGTLANPVVLGRTTLTGGSLIFMHNVYQVQSGTVVFANPIRTEPNLNLYVNTLVEDYNITLNFVGTLDRLRTNYTSDPALPPVDIIHLLTSGKTTEEAAATHTPAAMGAESAIAGQLVGQVSNRIEKLTGISELQIDPSLGGSNSDPGARLAIQERLTSSILFTFATDLTNTQNEVVQVRYQPRGRFSFSLTRDEYGSYAIQVKTHKSF